MQKGDKYLIALIIVAAIFLLLRFNLQKKLPTPTPTPETIKGVENPYLGTCTDGNGVVTDCEKGA